MVCRIQVGALCRDCAMMANYFCSSVHWIVPTIAGTFLATSLMLIFVAYLSYLVDVYLMYAASAIAANTIARSACGAAAPLFTNQMFKAMGVGGGGSLIGGMAALLAVVPFYFYKYGKEIRIRSKFAPTKEKMQAREKDEERDPTEFTLQQPEGSGVSLGEEESEGSSESETTVVSPQRERDKLREEANEFNSVKKEEN